MRTVGWLGWGLTTACAENGVDRCAQATTERIEEGCAAQWSDCESGDVYAIACTGAEDPMGCVCFVNRDVVGESEAVVTCDPGPGDPLQPGEVVTLANAACGFQIEFVGSDAR
jgi:hypothetical protein